MIWPEIQENGVPRRAPTPAILTSVVEATTALTAATRALVTSTLRPTAAAFLLVPLYTCSPERLSAIKILFFKLKATLGSQSKEQVNRDTLF